MFSRFRWRTQIDEQRKYAILFAATILAARKLNEIGSQPCSEVRYFGRHL